MIVCGDCGGGQDEFYMLRDDVWLSVARRNELLCVACVERRLQRPLSSADFNESFVNSRHQSFRRSMRLNQRLGFA